MDSGDNTRGHFNSIKVKARMEGRQDASKVAGLVCTVAGIGLLIGGLASTGLADFPRIAMLGGGLTCLNWAGIMVIAWGATSGHLAVYRLVEHTADQGIDQLDTVIELEKRTGRIVGDVLEDDLRRRREGNG